MVNIRDTEVSTALKDGNQLLRVKADIGGNTPESFFFLRPFGANTWFILAGRGREGSVGKGSDSTPQVVDEVEEILVDQGWPIRPINNSSNYPDTGTVELQFSSGGIHRYPLFADGASVVVAKEGDIDDGEVDARVEVEYSEDVVEYVVHVSDGDLPDNWVLEDLIIWADAVELGDTYYPNDELRTPKSINTLIL